MHYDKPTEPVWSNLKRSLANLTKHDIGQLTALVKTRLRRMQYRPRLLDGFLASTGLDLRSEDLCSTLARADRSPKLRLASPSSGTELDSAGVCDGLTRPGPETGTRSFLPLLVAVRDGAVPGVARSGRWRCPVSLAVLSWSRPRMWSGQARRAINAPVTRQYSLHDRLRQLSVHQFEIALLPAPSA